MTADELVSRGTAAGLTRDIAQSIAASCKGPGDRARKAKLLAKLAAQGAEERQTWQGPRSSRQHGATMTSTVAAGPGARVRPNPDAEALAAVALEVYGRPRVTS